MSYGGGVAAGPGARFGASAAAIALSDRVFKPSGNVDSEFEAVFNGRERSACLRPVQPIIAIR